MEYDFLQFQKLPFPKMKFNVFAKKKQADFAANNSNRKSFLLQTTFTRDAVAIFRKVLFPKYILYNYMHIFKPQQCLLPETR